MNLLTTLLEELPEELTSLLRRTFQSAGDETLKFVLSYAWKKDFIDEGGDLTLVLDEYNKTVATYEEYLDELAARVRRDKNARHIMDRIEKQEGLYKQATIIDLFSRSNILPKYGFPVDTVELMVNSRNNNDHDSGLKLQRDLQQAISEYAPGAKVIANGRMYTSRYIRKAFISKGSQDFHRSYLCECSECHSWNFRRVRTEAEAVCAMCKEPLPEIGWTSSIEPRNGFIAENESKPAPRRRPAHPYTNDASYIGDGNRLNAFVYRTNSRHIKLFSSEKDKILINSKDRFYVCPSCGYALGQKEAERLRSKKGQKKGNSATPVEIPHETSLGRQCRNQALRKEMLHHMFETDVVRMQFDKTVADEEMRYSVINALHHAACKVLDVEMTEIDVIGCARVASNSGFTVLFYDAAAGGAGHVHRLLKENGDVIARMIEQACVSMEKCNCDSSCYSCLRTYENRFVHDKLDRIKALEYLSTFRDKCHAWRSEGDTADEVQTSVLVEEGENVLSEYGSWRAVAEGLGIDDTPMNDWDRVGIPFEGSIAARILLGDRSMEADVLWLNPKIAVCADELLEESVSLKNDLEAQGWSILPISTSAEMLKERLETRWHI